jgi:ABC-type branched-subunit amino acid transport system substrate-binding protein
MRRSWRALSVAAAAVVAVGVAACGGSSSGSSGAGSGSGTLNLKIGDIVPLTGPAAVFGPSWDKAARLAAQDANKAASAAGLKLHVTIITGDEGSSPQTATTATRQLVSQGASCILGGLSSSDSIAMAKGVTIPAHVVQISPASSSVLYGNLHAQGGFTFRTIPSDALQSQLLADYMNHVLGGASGKTVSVAARDDSYGAPASQAFASAWKALGGSVSGPVLYDPNATSYDSEAAQIVRGHPAAFVIFDDPGTYAKVGAALLRTGAFSATKLFTTSGFPSAIAGSGIPAAALNGAHLVNAGLPQNGPALTAYEAAYSASTLKPSQAQPYNENNFDAAMLCAMAAAEAHSTSGSQIASRMLSVVSKGAPTYNYLQLNQAFAALKAGKPIDYQGVSGSTALNSSGDPTGTLADVSQYQNGKLVTLSQVQLTDGKLISK